MNIKAIIPAGGSSSRYKNGNKLLENLDGKTVIIHTKETLLSCEKIDEIIISASTQLIPELKKILNDQYSKIKIVQGGKTRQESVFNALKQCNNCNIVVIHDAARPLIQKDTINKCINTAIEKKAAIVAVRAIDTIKIVNSDNKIIETPNRETLWNVQTPQIFDFNLIFSAHEKLKEKNFSDDAGMLEFLGIDVYVVEGEYSNFKITTEKDLIQAELWLKSQNTSI